jgi:hypothetical protein
MPDKELSRVQREQDGRYAVFRRAAEKLARSIPGQTVESLVETMDEIYFSSSRKFEPFIEDGSIAASALANLADATDALKQAMEALGAGALTVLNRSNAPSSLRDDADAHELPLAENAPPDCSPEELLMWQRGGKWIVRLHALAELARQESDHVRSVIRSGSQKVFHRALADTEQRRIIRACILSLRGWGAPDGLALTMARAIQEVSTGEKPTKGWGRTPLSELLLSLPK